MNIPSHISVADVWDGLKVKRLECREIKSVISFLGSYVQSVTKYGNQPNVWLNFWVINEIVIMNTTHRFISSVIYYLNYNDKHTIKGSARNRQTYERDRRTEGGSIPNGFDTGSINKECVQRCAVCKCKSLLQQRRKSDACCESCKGKRSQRTRGKTTGHSEGTINPFISFFSFFTKNPHVINTLCAIDLALTDKFMIMNASLPFEVLNALKEMLA